jgi:hypothetical protein
MGENHLTAASLSPSEKSRKPSAARFAAATIAFAARLALPEALLRRLAGQLHVAHVCRDEGVTGGQRALDRDDLLGVAKRGVEVPRPDLERGQEQRDARTRLVVAELQGAPMPLLEDRPRRFQLIR